MEKMPVLFGTGDLEMRDDSIICGSDLFAGAFFMLTRWEEHVVKERDVHGRFCSSNSLASRFGFLNRAIVNEYIEYLWNMIYYLDSTAKRKNIHLRLFQPMMSMSFPAGIRLSRI